MRRKKKNRSAVQPVARIIVPLMPCEACGKKMVLTVLDRVSTAIGFMRPLLYWCNCGNTLDPGQSAIERDHRTQVSVWVALNRPPMQIPVASPDVENANRQVNDQLPAADEGEVNHADPQ